jgi:dTDP-4-dehydrorhamnose reductase
VIIQVVGSRGMLGQAVCEAVERAGHTLHSNGINIILVSPNQITGEVVINCAGIVKGQSLPHSEYIRVNAYGPQRLSEVCDTERARLIHVSTDCVFNDIDRWVHTEGNSPSPNDIYSVSKLGGEVTRSPHLTVRCSFVGHGKRGLLHELVSHPNTQRVEYDQLWSGHTVDTFAGVLVMLAEKDISGLLHVPGEFQSRKQLIERLSKRFNLGITVRQSNEHNGYDRRLGSDRWFSKLGLPLLPDFETQLARMKEP